MAVALIGRPAARGQVLPAFAVMLPVMLLPAVALAVGAAQVAAAKGRLAAAAASAVEDASGQLDVGAVRSGTAWRLRPGAAAAAATAALHARDPAATVDSLTVAGSQLTITCSERVPLPLGSFAGAAAAGVVVHATATARLDPGYSSPSSRLPFPVSTF